MSYRSILVHLDDSPRCAVRTVVATRLAREHGGHLLGLAPTGLINLPARVTPLRTGSPNYLEQAQAHLGERAMARLGAFERLVAEHGLESFEARADEAETVESLVAHGRNRDLIVMGQGDLAARGEGLDRDLPEQVLLQAGRPVLVVPFAGDFGQVGGDVIVAWKDSRESARAVHDALPFLRRARTVHLLCLERPGALRHVRRLQLNDLRHWLERQGVESHVHQDVAQAGIGESVLTRVCDLNADLVVMGGYGRSRMAEFVLGGVTRTLLARMTVPVLFSH